MSNDVETYYDTLMVASTAQPEVIRAAYRVLSQKYHPDKNGGVDHAKRMTRINEAYGVLSDPELRRQYDELLAAQQPKRRTSPPTSAPAGPRDTSAPPPAADGGGGRPVDRESEGRKFGVAVPLVGLLVVLAGVTFFIRDEVVERTRPDHVESPSSVPERVPALLSSTTATNEILAHLVVHRMLERGPHPLNKDSLWTSREFEVAGVRNFVAFVQQQPLERDGSVNDCHACAPEIAALTYRYEQGQWRLADVTLKAAQLGTWGKAPASKDVGLLAFPDHPALTLPWSDSGQGYTESGVVVLVREPREFASPVWRSLGALQTDGDNEGTCDERSDPPRPCWRYRGRVTVAGSGKFPDLVVVKEGTEMGATAEAPSAAAPVRYVFNGSAYAVPSQPKQ